MMRVTNGEEQVHDPHEGWLSRERVLALVLLVATGLALYLCYQLTIPFLPALAWALALAVVAHPLHHWIARRIPNANVAAGLSVVLVALIILIPTLFVVQHLARELTTRAQDWQAAATPENWRKSVEANPSLAGTLAWVEHHIDVPGEIQRAVTALAPQVQSVVMGSFQVGMQSLITLFALFFFFRDRHAALRLVRSLVPLSNPETDQVFKRVEDTIYATVYGTLLVALIQGALGGLIFWLLGLPAPMLWAVVMALLAIVPYLGTFVVWIPVAIYLAVQGDWVRALVLAAWGGIVIAFIDNLLYPFLVGQRMRLHTLPVFIAIVGGLALLGASGVILGPVILAVTLALLEVWRRRTAGGRTAEEGVNSERKVIVDAPVAGATK